MEYKFRGKRKADNRWIYGSLISWPDGDKEIITTTSEEEADKHMVHPETVGMWTGWNDKNGKEIYQGDKLKGMMGEQESENRSPITSTVILKPGGFEVFTKSMSRCILGRFTWCDHGYHGRRDVYRVIEELEVVGNIHDVKPAAKEQLINTMNNIDPNEKQAEEVKAAGQEIAAVESEAQEKAMESEEEGGTEG